MTQPIWLNRRRAEIAGERSRNTFAGLSTRAQNVLRLEYLGQFQAKLKFGQEDKQIRKLLADKPHGWLASLHGVGKITANEICAAYQIGGTVTREQYLRALDAKARAQAVIDAFLKQNPTT